MKPCHNAFVHGILKNTLCYSWFYHTWLITYLWPSLFLCRLFRPHGLILYFDVSNFIPENSCLLLYVSFKPILTCTCKFWPQTHVHRDVCIKPNNFGFFLGWVWISWLLAFHMPWDSSDLTLHYTFGVLYKEPLRYIEERGIHEQGNYIPLCLLLAYTWVYIPLSLWITLCSSQDFLCLVSLLSRDRRLRWWRPKWRTRFLWFIDVPTEVVTLVISDFINRNIFSYPIDVHLNMNIVSIDVFNCLYIIEYIC